MKRYTLLFIIATIVLGTTSCDSRKVYDHYEHISVSGWDKNQRLEFDIAPVTSDGTYALDLGLRTNGDYPFMRLTLVVECAAFPAKKTTTQKINCNLIDERGKPKGNGVMLYQYNFHVNDLQLNAGDSLHITVRHDMRREILPGISDIGLTLAKD